jgi:hypothetical protein
MAGIDPNAISPDDEKMQALLGLHPHQIAIAQALANGNGPMRPPDDAQPSADEQPPTRVISSPSSGPRGINVPPAPEPGSTADLEARADRPRQAPAAVVPTQQDKDQAEFDRRKNSPSGIEQWANRHGTFGQVIRGLAGVGGALAPGIAAAIPGTELHHEQLLHQSAGRLAQDVGQEKEEATTAETQARIPFMQSEEEKNRREAAQGQKESWEPILSGDKTIAGFRNTTTGELAGPDSTNLTPAMKSILGAAKPVPPKPDTATQNKENFQHGIGVLRGEGLLKAADVTDFKKISGAVENSKKLTGDEKDAMVGYMGANPTPGTNVQVHVQEGNATQSAKDARTHVLATGPDGKTILTTLDKANAQGLDSTPIKDPEAVTQTGRMANTIQISMNRLADPELLKLFDNPGARTIIATATDDNAARQFGAVIPGIGGLMIPVPGGVSKFIDSALQNSQLAGPDKEAVKKYLAGYWSAREAMMNLMRLQSGGKQGARGQFQAEAAIQQLPGGKTPDSATAKLQMEYAQESLDQYRSGIPDTLPGFKKEQSFKEKGGATTAPTTENQEPPTATGPNGHKIKVVGGRWVDAASGQPIQ